MDEKKKRGVGRPPIKPKPKPIEKKGIVDQPVVETSAIELKYDNVCDFKKISTNFTKLSTDGILMEFTPDGLALYGINHLGKTKIKVFIEGKDCIHYYCKEPVKMYIKRKGFDLSLNILDKAYASITFIIDSADIGKEIIILMENNFGFFDEAKIVGTGIFDGADQLSADVFEEKDEPALNFLMNSKYLKKIIGNSKKFSKKLEFLKISDEDPVEMTYTCEESHTDMRHFPSDHIKDFNLTDNTNGEMFSVSVYSSSMKPFSSVSITDIIDISLWRDHPLLITTDLSNGAVKFYIRIDMVDYTDDA